MANPKYMEKAKILISQKELKPREGKKEDPAHPSIFPTGNKPEKLKPQERKIYDLVVRRFLSVFAEPAVRKQVKLMIEIEGERFSASGITTLEENWMEFYKPYVRLKEQSLPEVNTGEKIKNEKIELLDKKTQPPSRYTQASILKEMEKLGLGTKATRAQILQTLYDRGYIKEKSIVVTELGEAVVKALEHHCPEIISVDLTRKLENEMEEIERGNKKRGDILLEARRNLERILQNFKKHERKIGEEILEALKRFEKNKNVIGACECGGELRIVRSEKTKKRFVGCSRYPECKVSYPLPQHGSINILSKTCKCGLKIISVKRKGKKPWRFCVKCGSNTTA